MVNVASAIGGFANLYGIGLLYHTMGEMTKFVFAPSRHFLHFVLPLGARRAPPWKNKAAFGISPLEPPFSVFFNNSSLYHHHVNIVIPVKGLPGSAYFPSSMLPVSSATPIGRRG